jgi:hypothetical protein
LQVVVISRGFGTLGDVEIDRLHLGHFQQCVPATGAYGLFTTCGEPLAIGVWCRADEDCMSGICQEVPTPSPLPKPEWWDALVPHETPQLATCGSCRSDADCEEGQVCGIESTSDSTHRSCVTEGSGRLGQLCAADDECARGICCDSICQACCDGVGCADCRRRNGGAFQLGDVTFEHYPLQCSPGTNGSRKPSGEECLVDGDCLSGRCNGTEELCPAYTYCDSLRACRDDACASSLSLLHWLCPDERCPVSLVIGGTCA